MESQGTTGGTDQQQVVMQIAGQNGQQVIQTVNGQQVILQGLGGAGQTLQLAGSGGNHVQIIPIQNLQQAAGGAQQMVLQQSPQIVQTQDGQTVLFQPVQMDGGAQVSAAPAATPAAAATPQRHVEERDNEVADLTRDLAAARSDIKALQERTENAEMNSRIPCLILSGGAMASRRKAVLGAPLPVDGSAPRAPTSDSSAAEPAGSGGAPVWARERGPAAARRAGEPEDVGGLVISAVRARLPGLSITEQDIDRAHRLPGPNNKVIVRFVRSGPGSVRDQLMSRRLELKGQDLFINESLTAGKSQIYRSLLEAKKTQMIYTVFTRWGHVFFKSEKFGTSTRVDSIEKLRELRFPVKQ
ncbi:hypothetical protein FJT64_004599 [Amphibalanus amphitrite]|nr:hypothetical protein FJT64_004599 [Amphibalanus amphitrite]